MIHYGIVTFACIALSFALAACGGSGKPSVSAPEEKSRTLQLEFPPGGAVEHQLPFRIPGGVPPFKSSIDGCPDWVTLFPDQGILAGSAPVEDHGRIFFCIYLINDSSLFGKRALSHGLRLVVGPSIAADSLSLPQLSKVNIAIRTFHSEELPAAAGGVPPYTYSFTCIGGVLPSGMGFGSATRVFAGTPDARFRDSCTYTATDSSQPAVTVSRAVEVEVSGRAVIPLSLPQDFVLTSPPGAVVSFPMERRARVGFAPATGGVAPYTYEILGCELPRGLRFSPDARTLTGSPLEVYRGPDCTYRVTDSALPPAVESRDFALIVDPLDLGKWRFRTRSVPQSDHPLTRQTGVLQIFTTLPHALGGSDYAGYELRDIGQGPLEFNARSRELSYSHTGVDPLFETPTTFRYLVSANGKVNDALCVDIAYRDPPPREERPNDGVLSTVRITVRDDAYWDGTEYRCPDSTAPAPRSAAQNDSISNPVHTALAPIHARRAVDVAHTAVRYRVRSWSPDDPRGLSAIDPAIGLASLSGRTEGFDYTGSSESLSAGAELGAGSWQTGLVASFARTDLDYRAEADLSKLGYLAGEHNTEILSVHPFAAWHIPSGGHLWASVGAGLGHLRHRDDLGFPSWSRSDVRLLSQAAGASLPLADVLSGELQAEAGIESFSFEIKGGDQISSSLPTLRGRDYRAGLVWSAPVPGTPSLAVAYKRLTGDGPQGGQLEAEGSVSVDGIFDPRLILVGSAEGSFGLGDYEQTAWGLGIGVRFAPDGMRRGLELELDTSLVSLGDGVSPDVGIRGEVGYGLWGGPLYGAMRPYIGLVRYQGENSVRRTLGADLRDTPNSKIKVELHDHPRDRFRAIYFTFRRRL